MTARLGGAWMLAALLGLPLVAAAGDRAARAELVAAARIWREAPHNAFTDLVRFKDGWLCAFREGSGHVSHDGKVRVIASADGSRWASAALLTAPGPLPDLRDPKLSLMPDGRLMLVAAAASRMTKPARHQTYGWYSADGKDWGRPATVGDPNVWLWRVAWHKGSAYGVGYDTGGQFARLYRSADGRRFEPLAERLFTEGYPNEASLAFEPDGTCHCLLRRDGRPNTAMLGQAGQPYTSWTWKDLGVRIGGPGLLRLDDGRLLVAGRRYDGGTRTSLMWLDPAKGSLTEFLPLPSGGDTSYPGLVMHEGVLWISYYSSHEGKASIYLAKVKLPAKEDGNMGVDKPQSNPPSDEGAEAERREVARCEAEIDKNRKSDATVRVVDADGKSVSGAEIVIEQTGHDFLFGCNIYRFDRFKAPAENEAYKRRFEELFNYATVGFYWRWYEPKRGEPMYAYTDQVVAWCRARGIAMKGHPLLWGHEAGVPVWSKGQPPAAVQKQRVMGIVKRFAGTIGRWEVVNEPSHCRGVAIDEPYRWARQADPNAYLIVNDYYVMANGYEPFHRLLVKAKADSVPFEGIGIQAHEPRTMRFPLDQVRKVLDRYATLGKELHITEFTPCSGGQKITGSHLEGIWDEQAQADYAVKFYKACFAHPAVVAVTWWDLCDNGSWLPGGGMLRADLSPKPVYTALTELIHGQWTTKVQGKTDGAGVLQFRGFRGRYAVSVQAAGGAAEGKRHLKKDAPNHWELKLARP